MMRKEIFRILCDFEIRHTDVRHENEAVGMTDLENKVIYIDPKQSTRDKIDTIIHELYHALSDHYGRDWSEEEVTRRTTKLTKLLYGDDNETK